MSHLVVMGVSGSGKSAVGERVAGALGHTFADGDDFHPPRNIATMARGEPLRDSERAPWLRALAAWLSEQHAAGRSTVLACSALKRRYRDVLRRGAPELRFCHLTASREVLLERMRKRSHFMPPALIDSQLETLEPLDPDELGFTVDASGKLDDLVAEILGALATTR